MQAIKTRVLAPTNTRGWKIVAECYGVKVVIPRQCHLNWEENGAVAVEALMTKLGLAYKMDNFVRHGGAENGESYWVLK